MASKKTSTERTGFRNDDLFCYNCGGSHKINYPMSTKEFAEITKNFSKLHAKCKSTWVEPEVDMSKTVKERAEWWIINGETGASSKVIWRCLTTGVSTFENPSHPLDPDDFKRCYKLLEAIPEWKSEIHKLKSLSKIWSNLVDNWNKLTEMYEQNVKENWVNYEAIGMHKLMNSLGC